MTIRSQAKVGTDKPSRYAKQLSSHLGRKCEVSEEPEGIRITLPADRGAGSCLLVSEPDALALRAEAENAEVLDRVQDVIGRHLERFGQRDELTVDWTND
ncbi:hypothetical protein SAMN05216215_107919 [Saccharopolyspora shandongensis]|uniref:DUF2218 domain-containing protein n=1 Tax=Saccharopolyspora shandongensis TaxID=418495 RepID=A0A1H3TCU0_9PSEU|nr:DUF2218 domain-containing protein [Saccharopolyspora shandongensis]SDZ47920.1 hypothetical protein SAMN05216215_107919 [Saccharopolyspora shandongensis]